MRNPFLKIPDPCRDDKFNYPHCKVYRCDWSYEIMIRHKNHSWDRMPDAGLRIFWSLI